MELNLYSFTTGNIPGNLFIYLFEMCTSIHIKQIIHFRLYHHSILIFTYARRKPYRLRYNTAYVIKQALSIVDDMLKGLKTDVSKLFLSLLQCPIYT